MMYVEGKRRNPCTKQQDIECVLIDELPRRQLKSNLHIESFDVCPSSIKYLRASVIAKTLHSKRFEKHECTRALHQMTSFKDHEPIPRQ